MELLDIIKQTVWGRMAAMNFILGGTAAGGYLLLAWYGHFSEPFAAAQSAWWKLLSVSPACLGFAGVLVESARPLRGIYLLHRLRTSWMSREVLAGMIFISAAAADILFPRKGFTFVAAPAAAALIVTQGFMLYTARAVPPWNKALTPLLIAVSALTNGFGFLMFTSPWFDADFARKTTLTGLVLLVFNLGIWLAYLYQTPGKDFRRATQALRSPASRVMVVGLGHAVPIFWLIVLSPTTSVEKYTVSPLACIIVGLLVWSGAAYQKAVLVLKCSYLNGLSWRETNGAETLHRLSTPHH